MRTPSPVEYAMEVTEDTVSGSEKSSNASGGHRRSLTPRAGATERAAPVHEPDAQVSRERMVRFLPLSLSKHGDLKIILQISVATFHLGRFELAQQSVGSHACIKIQGASLSGEECTAISWEEFQVRLTLPKFPSIVVSIFSVSCLSNENLLFTWHFAFTLSRIKVDLTAQKS